MADDAPKNDYNGHPAARTTAAEASFTPPPPGVPTQLIRKVLIVPPAEDRLPVYTLTFAIPEFSYQTDDKAVVPHSQVRLDRGDIVKMVIPNYKPKSYSISELRETEFDVTMKVYPNGRASGFLDRLKVGDTIHSFGKHVSRTYNNTPKSYVGILVFGVGITEGFPVAKAELEKGCRQVVLVWASRTMHDTFWHDKLRTLSETFPGKFQLIFLLSRQEPPPLPKLQLQQTQDKEEQQGNFYKGPCRYWKGRISPEILQQMFQPPIKEEARFLTVGTKEMMKIADGMLTSIGFPMPEQHLLPKIK